MNILLDTHALLWLIAGDNRLSRKANQVFLDRENNIYLSAASYWEICIKISLGKLKLDENWEHIINHEISFNNIRWLQISKDHCRRIVNLPFHHRDPFDRILIAQAMIEDMHLMTCDERIYKYKVPVIW